MSANSEVLPASPSQQQERVTASSEVPVIRWNADQIAHTKDQVAEETPVAFLYNGVPHIVMLATPANLEELAIGFTMSEALVEHRDEIVGVEIEYRSDAAEVHIAVTAEKFSRLLRRQRNLTGRTGCGLCGVENVDDALRLPDAVPAGRKVNAMAMHAALALLPAEQTFNSSTGSIHAAAWVDGTDRIVCVREDVGRHNALDKLIGALVQANIDRSQGYAIITSRASYEMVLKSATLGIPMLVAVSAPTALAIRLAEKAGLTLIGFARETQHVIYTHAHRIGEA
jgi:FdhD protein